MAILVPSDFGCMGKILGHDARLLRQEVDPEGKRRRKFHHQPVANSRPRKLVVPLNQYTYRLHGFAPHTADDAIYELFVDARALTDLVGNTGTQSQSYRWVKGELAPTVLELVGAPRGLTTTGTDWIDLVMSKPIDLDALKISDLSLSHDAVELLDSEVTISQVGDTTYRVGNLGRLTGDDGVYQFVFDAAAIRDLDGRAGLGDTVATWTLDATPPQLVGVIPPATNPRNIVVQRIDIEFSEPIDIDTLSVDALSLVREGDPANLIAGDSRIFFEHRFDNIYRIHGINWAQGFIADPQVATFTLTVDAHGVRDLAGNPGSGVMSTSWTIDLDRPEPPADLILATAGGPVVGGLVNSLDARISGTLSEPGLTIAVRDTRAGADLVRKTISGTEFDLPIRFASPGHHELRVRAIDAAGNTSDAFLTGLFVKTIPPLIESILGIPDHASNEPVDFIDVVFTTALAPGSLTRDSLSMSINDQELLDTEVTITSIGERTYRIGNLERLMTEDGVYRFAVHTERIQNIAGNVGSETVSTSWILDTTAPSSRVQALPDTVTNSHFTVFWHGNDGDSGSGINHYDIYVSIDGDPFELWLRGVDETFALYQGRPGRSYAFYSVATDNAGHQESKNESVEASTIVFVSTAWQNPFNRYDVNDTGQVTPLDVLLILNQIARSRRLESAAFPEEFQPPYYDVNGDGRVEPLDALLVLNFISRRHRRGEGELAGQTDALAAPSRIARDGRQGASERLAVPFLPGLQSTSPSVQPIHDEPVEASVGGTDGLSAGQYDPSTWQSESIDRAMVRLAVEADDERSADTPVGPLQDWLDLLAAEPRTHE